MSKTRVVQSYKDKEGKYRWRAGIKSRFDFDIKLAGTEAHETMEQAKKEAQDWLGYEWKFTWEGKGK